MDQPHGLNILDCSVVGIILLSGLLALMRGFVREILSLAAWAIAGFIAATDYAVGEPWTREWVKNETAAAVLSGSIIFIVTLVILTFAGWLITRLIRGRTLSSIDRSLGFLFGLLRGVLVCCALYLVASYLPFLNMEKLDKGPTGTQLLEANNATTRPSTGDKDQLEDKDKNKDKENDKERDQPPQWLVNAKTRPALAYGANILKAYVPEKELEKGMNEFDEQNKKAHRTIEEKTEDMIGLPAKSPQAPQDTDNKATNDLRDKLGDFLEKSKQ